jgi:Fe-S-cluster containining protein
MKEFQCSSCGACCRRVREMGDFDLPINEDGSCSELSPEGKCNIYETRPVVCRVEESYYRLNTEGKKVYKTKLDWYKKNSKICNDWIKEDGLDNSFLIDLDKYK